MKKQTTSKILVVDDEVGNIDELCGILLPMYDVIVAKNGKSALEKAKKHLPSLILLDVVMSDMSGFEVITSLKNSELTQRIPVIFVTGLVSSADEEKGLLLGAVDYITKPFNSAIVKARIRTQLQIVEYIEMIENLCRVDALTNVANRRYLDNQLRTEWGMAVRDSRDISFLMIDIDFFKKYNDTYGHPQGDLLLKSISQVFTESMFRPSDFVARWGGEEFAVLLPEINIQGALNVAERIRNNVEKMTVPCSDGAETRVTVSIGVNSIVPTVDSTVEEFIAAADQALYVAKTSGRNRVSSAVSELELV